MAMPGSGGLSNDEYNRWVQVERALATNAAEMLRVRDDIRSLTADLASLRRERETVGMELARKIERLDENMSEKLDGVSGRVEKFEAEQKFWRRIWAYAAWVLGIVIAIWQGLGPELARKLFGGPSAP